MTKSKQIQRLEQVATLLFDGRLTDLRRAAQARAETEARLVGLEISGETVGGLPHVVAERAALTYQRWADVRRAELNQTLSRQTADWLDAQQAARQAFGKTQALAGVAAKLAATVSKSR